MPVVETCSCGASFSDPTLTGHLIAVWREQHAVCRAAAARAQPKPAGLPRAEACPTCRLTRWEAKQVEGFMATVTEQRDAARAEVSDLRYALNVTNTENDQLRQALTSKEPDGA